MGKRLRRNTDIIGTHYEWKKFGNLFTVGLGFAATNNGVGFVTITIKSKLEPKDSRALAISVMHGRLTKALDQYRLGGRVRVKLTTLIPAKSMPNQNVKEGSA